ncbi:uncharacterized protein K02A2.6-like [Sabethes cyaneus]|uniref:uncharacterized protein K02A2.6-like n=1 Tax=Sabethes cyaneus TaxID=53552 RepID=UPI00237E1446|nr:uncharacterized protein K02A2.6-like [Sabethes cyaneus]
MVGGRTPEEHLRKLYCVLTRRQEFGFTVRIEKCSFNMRQVKYLGQILEGDGIRPDPEKVAAIVNMSPPHDMSTLRSYLGAINYYGKYVREMRILRQPMDQLLKTGTKFEWSSACQKSFDRFRELLQSPLLLTHYNPAMDIVVSADASTVGLGARIAHRFPDGTVKAIYHNAVWSSLHIGDRPQTTSTDIWLEEGHSHRLQRWALTLLLYDFEICYIATDSFGRADVLSRLINRHVRPEEEYVIANLELEDSVRTVINESLQVFPLSFKAIQSETKGDVNLQQVIRRTKNSITDPGIQQFYQRRESLSVVAGCLLYSERVVIPPSFRKRVLQQLHKGHPGIERMRSVARQHVYWPNIDDDVAKLVAKPWQRLHLDYAGPLDGNFFLILVDSYTKWPEVVQTKEITTTATLRILRGIFARYGQPETLVTDNGTQLTSDRFESYCDKNGIVHLKTAPFHPQSNGLAERFVDTFKRSLKKIIAGGETLDEAMDTFLLCYRTTPCRSAPGGKSPADLMYGRPIRTSLELLRPPTPYHKLPSTAQEKQFNRKHGAKAQCYNQQDHIWAKVYAANKWTWQLAIVIERIGRVMYNIWLPSKQNLIRSHCN